MRITIPGDPIPKARARHARRGTFVVTYDSQQVQKENVIKHIKYQMMINSKEISELTKFDKFCVNMDFYLPIPRSFSQFKKNSILWGLVKHNSKPDCSNFYKFYEDCANSLLFHDDSMIILGNFSKHYSDNPRTEIEIMAIPDITIPSEVNEILKVFSPDEIRDIAAIGSLLDLNISYKHDERNQDPNTLIEIAKCLEGLAQYTKKLTKIQKYKVNHETTKKSFKEGKILC